MAITSPSDEIKLEVLCGHYKDSFERSTQIVKFRDWLFVFILIAISLLLFEIVAPKDFGTAASSFLAKQLSTTSIISLAFIQSVIWFGLLALIVRYFQIVIYLERLYKYIHGLEEILAPHFDNKSFTREGKTYLTGYPVFSKWALAVYTKLFPVLLILVGVISIAKEWFDGTQGLLFLLIDTALGIAVLISTCLYVYSLHKKP